MKNVSVLGSTGSIGTQTLDIIRQYPFDFRVVALTAKKNIELLEKQIREFRPVFAAVWDEDKAKELKVKVADLDVKVLSGMEGLIACASCYNANIVVTAIVGMIGIQPTIAALESGKDVALANKETLVTAGSIIMPLAKENGRQILPVDSEHSAIFQSIQGNDMNKIERILLTASGGPFRGKSREFLETVTLEQALKHPNWSMGPKITVDSSTMVNKGLEVIEARWLFDVDPKQIEVHVHPQSIVHSAVEFVDGAVIAQMGTPDMHVPIAYALNYPKRMNLFGKKLNLFELGSLTFEKPDLEVFRGLKLAYRAIEEGGIMPTVLNAANEKAVAMFLNGQIRYTEITDIIEYAMDEVGQLYEPDIEDILDTEEEVYETIESRWQ